MRDTEKLVFFLKENNRFELGSHAKESLGRYKSLRSFCNTFMRSKIISGKIKDSGFIFFEGKKSFRKYSCVIVDAGRYEIDFDSIVIKKESVFHTSEDFDLEWIQFNDTFHSDLENPRQALEVISPTFMEQLKRFHDTYDEIVFEYFEEPSYFSHHILCMIPGYIFSSTEDVTQAFEKIEKLAEHAVDLQESI